ncbi:efflux transporter outer membrane subunit [Tamlana fucoidanivorans]|nr:efflux transporter outer membrane subunit [Tamlana fucoidanivorans]
MNSKLLFVVVLVFIFLLEGCKVGPKYRKPVSKIDSTAVYRFDSLKVAQTDSLINIKWWEMFDDPVLEELIKIGLAENQDLLIASSRIDQAKALLGMSRADLWPKFGYNGSATRGNLIAGQPNPDLSTSNLFTGFGTINWELDFWGKFRRANEAAKGELLASEFGKRSVQIGLISQIATTYYQLLDFKWRLYISQKTLELRDKSLFIVSERYKNGIVPEIDLNQSQIQRAIAAAAVPFFERSIAQTENALAVILGRVPQAIQLGKALNTQNMPPDIPVGLPSLLLTRRPDIMQTEYLVQAQNARIGVAVAQRFPSISLTGFLGLASTDISDFTSNPTAYAGAVNILGPLFEFGKNKRRVDVERYKTEQAILQYEKTVITAFKEVEDALVAISTLKNELEARKSHVKAAENAQYLSSERYDKGVTSYLELIESQRQAFEASLGLSEATQKLFSAYIFLYKALGGGWISEDEMIQAAQAQEN